MLYCDFYPIIVTEKMVRIQKHHWLYDYVHSETSNRSVAVTAFH